MIQRGSRVTVARLYDGVMPSCCVDDDDLSDLMSDHEIGTVVRVAGAWDLIDADSNCVEEDVLVAVVVLDSLADDQWDMDGDGMPPVFAWLIPVACLQEVPDERVAALEAEVARLRAVIAAERGLAAPEGWGPEGPGWLHLGDDGGNLDRYVWPDGRDTSAGKDRREGTWWGWVVDERADGRLTRSVRGLAPTALEAMEAADAAAEVARG